MELERIDSATVVELQKQPEPVVIRYSVPVCRCKDCGRKVRGKAPGLAPDQHGATAHRFGPRVMAMAHLLHYGFGITVRKVPAVLHATTGLSITSSAITQNALKQSEGAVGEAYHKLRNSMRTAPVIYTDDTGWRIGGKNAHLMGFDSDIATVYQIREHHRNEEVREIIPADYAGTMVSDRGKSYDAEALDGTRQQKCVGHIQHNIADVLEAKTGPARTFGLRLKGLFQEALALKKSPPADPENAIEEIEDLQQRLTHQLRDRTLTDDDNQRLLNGLGAQMDRGRLLTFLYIPEVEATNNRAERIIRPAVIARKVSQCSKNERGANAHSAFMSIIQTAYKSVPAAAQKIQNALLALLVGSPETG